MKTLAIGGVYDHLHSLLSLPGTMSFAKAVQLIKGGSSKWIHEELGLKKFEWQEGYGAFSVSQSRVKKTIAYINSQREHHRKLSEHSRLNESVGCVANSWLIIWLMRRFHSGALNASESLTAVLAQHFDLEIAREPPTSRQHC